MRGLLLKDFYVVRSGLFVLLVTLLFIGFGMSIAVDPWVFITMSALLISTQTNGTICSDKITNWNLFSSTLPLSEELVISSKYFLNLLLSIFGIGVGVIISATVSIFLNIFEFELLFTHIFVAILMSLLPATINIPLSIMFDVTKQTIGMLLSFTFAIIILVITIVIANFFMIDVNLIMISCILAIVSAIIYSIAWFFVPKLLSKRER